MAENGSAERKDMGGAMDSENGRQNRLKGYKGEDMVCIHMAKNGWSILDRNYRCPMGELDIVAARDGVLAFVEVKTRSRTDYGLPCQSVDRTKRRKLRLCAAYYLKCHSRLYGLQPRMDIAELLERPSGIYLRYLENAFGEE